MRSYSFTVTTNPLEQDPSFNAVLGDYAGTYGSELRLRDSDDRTAHLHETSPAFLYQRCKYLLISNDYRYLAIKSMGDPRWYGPRTWYHNKHKPQDF